MEPDIQQEVALDLDALQFEELGQSPVPSPEPVPADIVAPVVTVPAALHHGRRQQRELLHCGNLPERL